jgi:hypothetical protein
MEMERGSDWPLGRMMNRSRKFVRGILQKRKQSDAWRSKAGLYFCLEARLDLEIGMRVVLQLEVRYLVDGEV